MQDHPIVRRPNIYRWAVSHLKASTVHVADVEPIRDCTLLQASGLTDYRTLLGVPLLREGQSIGAHGNDAQQRGAVHGQAN